MGTAASRQEGGKEAAAAAADAAIAATGEPAAVSEAASPAVAAASASTKDDEDGNSKKISSAEQARNTESSATDSSQPAAAASAKSYRVESLKKKTVTVYFPTFLDQRKNFQIRAEDVLGSFILSFCRNHRTLNKEHDLSDFSFSCENVFASTLAKVTVSGQYDTVDNCVQQLNDWLRSHAFFFNVSALGQHGMDLKKVFQVDTSKPLGGELAEVGNELCFMLINPNGQLGMELAKSNPEILQETTCLPYAIVKSVQHVRCRTIASFKEVLQYIKSLHNNGMAHLSLELRVIQPEKRDNLCSVLLLTEATSGDAQVDTSSKPVFEDDTPNADRKPAAKASGESVKPGKRGIDEEGASRQPANKRTKVGSTISETFAKMRGTVGAKFIPWFRDADLDEN